MLDIIIITEGDSTLLITHPISMEGFTSAKACKTYRKILCKWFKLKIEDVVA